MSDAYTINREHLRARLRLLESDLKDCHDPKVLARWPNLGSDLLKQELKVRIDEVKKMLELPS
jgi:hypothetical protein